ncbi:TRAPP complex subunit trs31 [Cantharellus anzutake]|uniref:TRAPP complex subunit trs31 n=1 Tax=Cantharellus anzutake TaxID=1750568 RepID=UPI00190327E1|nr:TRAPP complex subunit trs31 [Cantharellus anzutake]KAF8320543.1 TRAPP complex subunit trs31 [Cantharellus anzutake]
MMGPQPPNVARLSLYNSPSSPRTSSPVPASANTSRFSVATSTSGPAVPHPISTTATNASAAKARSAIYDRNLNKSRMSQVSLSAYAFLFSEIVQYTQKRVSGIGDLERRLSTVGYRIGLRVAELLAWRNDPTKNPKREIKLVQALMFIHTQVWKAVFGKPADALERGLEKDDEYMIVDNDPIITRYISIPKDMSQLSCSALTAGIVEAVLDGLGFPARVTAHSVPTDAHPLRTTILIKLDPSVLEREDALK